MIVIPEGVDAEFSAANTGDLRGLRAIREILVDVLSRYELAGELAADVRRSVPNEPEKCSAAEAA